MNILFEKKSQEIGSSMKINENLKLLIEKCKQAGNENRPTFDDFINFFKTTPFSGDSGFISEYSYQKYLNCDVQGNTKYDSLLNLDSIEYICNYFIKNKEKEKLSSGDLFLLNSLSEGHVKQLAAIVKPLKDKLVRYLYNEDISLIIPKWYEICEDENPFNIYKELMSSIETIEKKKNNTFYLYKKKEDFEYQIEALRIQAIHFLTEASNQKNIEAQIELAVQYVKGYILPYNLTKASEILNSIKNANESKSKLINHMKVQITKALENESTDKIINRIPRDQKAILKKAQEKHVLSMLYVGFAFFTGFNGFPILRELSVKFYEEAAKESPEAMTVLGYLYFNGILFPRNLNEARKCFLVAAEQGCIKAEIIDCLIRKHVWRSYLADFDANDIFNYYTQSMVLDDPLQFPKINFYLDNDKFDSNLVSLSIKEKHYNKYESNESEKPVLSKAKLLKFDDPNETNPNESNDLHKDDESESIKSDNPNFNKSDKSNIIYGTFLFANKIKKWKKKIGQTYSEKVLLSENTENYDEFQLAKSYFYGKDGFPVNYTKAAQYFKEAADKGDSEAQWRYAMLCLNSIGEDINDVEYYFRESSKQDNYKGKFYYAIFLKQKRENINLFKIFMKECCDAGDPDAMFNYAMYLETDEHNFEQSVSYYKKAAELSHFDSLIRLNYLFKIYANINIENYKVFPVGMLNEKLIIKLIHFYDNNENYTQSNILIQNGISWNPYLYDLYFAYHLLYGKGIPTDKERAEKIADLAFENKYPKKYQEKYIYLMLQILVNNHEQGKALDFLMKHRKELNAKYTEHFHIFYKKFNKNLARKNCIHPCFCCEEYRDCHDLIRNSNSILSFSFLIKYAQEKDNSFALAMVGKGYKQGKYVVRNLETAIQYFARSAEMGCPLGYYFIGKEYYYGRYIEQSYTKATKYFKLALNTEPRAGYYLYKIHKIRNDPKIDGLEMLKIGVEFGHKKALFKYGKLLYNGDEGFAKNEKEGKKMHSTGCFSKV